MAYKQANIDAEIKSKAENMIADRKFALEKDMRNRSAKLEQMYKTRTCDLQAKYKKMTVGYQSMIFVILFYGAATTIITAMKMEIIGEDFILFLNMCGDALKALFAGSMAMADYGARLGNLIPQTIIANIVHWLIYVVIIIGIVGASGGVLLVLGKKYFNKEINRRC